MHADSRARGGGAVKKTMDGQRPAYLKAEDGVLLTAHEAEHIVENLKCFQLDQVGTSEWMKQHKNLEKLNLQAHYNTIAHIDEFVMEALFSFEKMGVLIHELLAIEVWKEKILPFILEQLAAMSSTIRLSRILYQEVTITKIFEIMLFHREACEALGGENLLELADYCYRKLVYLNTDAPKHAAYKERSAQEVLSLKSEVEMEEKAGEIQFGCAMSALTIVRYLSDYINVLPPCVMARMIDTHDVIMSLVALIETSPWERKRKRQGKFMTEKYEEGKWVEVQPQDRFKLSKSEAQVWLALNNLVVDIRCRAKYNYDDFRQSQVLKLRKYINQMMLEQLPVLRDLQWALEEISLKVIATDEDRRAAHLIMEEIPQVRERLLSRGDWRKVAENQLTILQSNPSLSGDSPEEIEELMRMFQFGESMENPKCASCGAPAVQRCSRCKNDWYCGRSCQVSNWKVHKRICDTMSSAGKYTGSS